MYCILENHKVLVGDEDREKLIKTLDFMPQFNESQIFECEVETAYTGDKYEQGYAPEKPAQTREEQEQARENAYVLEVDPITAHIQRLKDEEQTAEVLAEIELLKAERTAKVASIKERYPYPVEG